MALVIVILFWVMSVPVSCGRSRQCMSQLSDRYLFVKGMHPIKKRRTSSDSAKRTSSRVGSERCPWSWGMDEGVDRFPRFLTKAECPRCGLDCRAVVYPHTVLVQSCTRETGMICTWKTKERSLPIAFVYNPLQRD